MARYEFWYDIGMIYILVHKKPKYKEKVKSCYMDTDSS